MHPGDRILVCAMGLGLRTGHPRAAPDELPARTEHGTEQLTIPGGLLSSTADTYGNKRLILG